MTFHDTTADVFESDDIFAHWRADDARIAAEQEAADLREAVWRALDERDLDTLSLYHDQGLVDDATYALELYGCLCRRCRKFDPAGCVG